MCPSPPKAALVAWAGAEGASGSGTQPFWLGNGYLSPEAGESSTLWLFSGHGTTLQDTRCAILLMHWAISPGCFQESGSGLTLLISGEAGKPKTPEHLDGAGPAGWQRCRERGNSQALVPAAAALPPRTVTQPSEGRVSVLPCLLAALLILRGTRMQPFLRNRADTSP